MGNAGAGVFVTGGTGLLGSHIAERLREEGLPVRALCRATSPKGHLRRIGAVPVEGDIRDGPEQLAAAIGDSSVVIHAAAVVYRDWPWPRLRALNVDGARRLARAAALAGAQHFVHLSSVAVYGPAAGPLDESAPLDAPLRPGDLYARSKREAEEAVREVSGRADLPLTILRPSVVYGERDRLFSPRLARVLRMPLIPLPGPGTAALPVVYAGNVADCVAALVERRIARTRPGSSGRPDDDDASRTPPAGNEASDPEVYNLASDDSLSARALLEGLARGMGRRRPRFLPVPLRLAGGSARVAEVVYRLAPGTRVVPPFRRTVDLAVEGNPYRSERVRQVLGWEPPFTAEEALTRTGRWLAGR